jgi:hypothetical protein
MLLLSSLLLLVAVDTLACIPALAGIHAVAIVPLVPDVLTVAGFLAMWHPYNIAGVPALAFVPAVAGVLSVAGVLALASISADANDPILAGVLTYCTVQCIVHCTMRNIRLSNCQTMAIGQLFFSAIGLLKYQI